MSLTDGKFKLLLKWLRKEKSSIYKIYALAILQGAIYLTIPLSIQGIITYIMAGHFSASLFLLSLTTIIATVFIGLLQLWQIRINETLQQKIFAGVTDSYAGFLAKGINEELRKKIVYFFEVTVLQKGIGKILLDFSFSVISLVFGLLLLPAYSSWFLIFTVLLSAAFYLIVSFYGKRAQSAHIETSNHKYSVFNTLNIPSAEQGHINGELDAYIDSRKNYYNLVESQYKGILVFKILFVSVLLLFGVYLVQIGELNVGQFVAAEIVVLLVINSVEKLVSSLDTFYDLTTGLYKLETALQAAGNLSFVDSEDKFALSAAKNIYRHRYGKVIKVSLYMLLVLTLVFLFLPWTQTVDMEGHVSVLNPENKPQQVSTRIAGRIEKWYISDGDFVKKNDTIAFISEIKEEYLDTMLISRSESQVKSKETSLQSYESKINAIDEQIDALNKSLLLKTQQIKNKMLQVKAKLSIDSIESVAALNNLKVAEEQFKRYEELLQKGVISKTEYENRKVKLQESTAKKISAENKIIGTKNELLNAELELNTTQQEYNEKLMKTESEKYSTLSLLYEAEGSLTKLQNQLSNYSLRSKYYYVLAPQDGYINHMVVKGVGEIVKEGGVLCNIVPINNEQVVELYISPVDLPLMQKGQEVNLIFDGWPSFVFSGWPGVSYGAFKAEVVSFDKVISDNGKFRVLAVNKGERWPEAIQIGGGAKGFALLHNVPLIYELWRIANGFPPEFYKKAEPKEKKSNEKK